MRDPDFEEKVYKELRIDIGSLINKIKGLKDPIFKIKNSNIHPSIKQYLLKQFESPRLEVSNGDTYDIMDSFE